MATGFGRGLMATGLAIAVGAVGGCIIVVDGTHDDDWHHSYHDGKPRAERTWSADIHESLLAETDALRVKSRAGDVTIEPTEGPARVEAHARGPNADRVQEIRLAMRSEGGTLHIEPVWPRDTWRNNESVDLVIRVPTREGVEVRTSAGDVEVAAMAGTLRIETSAGDVEVDGHDGAAHVDSSAGDIWMEHVTGEIGAETSAGDIDLHDVGWPIEAITSSGDVTVMMRPGFSGVLHAATSAGDIDLPGPGERRRTGPIKSVSLEMGEGEDECVFKTSSGDVTVRVRGG